MVLLQVCWSLHSWASVSTAGSVEKAACACMVLMTYGSRRWVVVFIFFLPVASVDFSVFSVSLRGILKTSDSSY